MLVASIPALKTGLEINNRSATRTQRFVRVPLLQAEAGLYRDSLAIFSPNASQPVADFADRRGCFDALQNSRQDILSVPRADSSNLTRAVSVGHFIAPFTERANSGNLRLLDRRIDA